MRTVFVVRGGAPAANENLVYQHADFALTEKEELDCLLKRILERKIEVEGHGMELLRDPGSVMVMTKSVEAKPSSARTNTLPAQPGSNRSSIAIEPCPT